MNVFNASKHRKSIRWDNRFVEVETASCYNGKLGAKLEGGKRRRKRPRKLRDDPLVLTEKTSNAEKEAPLEVFESPENNLVGLPCKEDSPGELCRRNGTTLEVPDEQEPQFRGTRDQFVSISSPQK